MVYHANKRHILPELRMYLPTVLSRVLLRLDPKSSPHDCSKMGGPFFDGQ
jgi:hypothetical protein